MKNNYRRLIIIGLITIIIFLCVMTVKGYAAGNKFYFQTTIHGKVVDKEGLPIPGVAVNIKNSSKGVATNLDGTYSIEAAPDAVLVFSYLGFKNQEVPVKERSEINIILLEDVTALDEVEINAGYYNTTKRESTGNISRVTAEEIEAQPVSNPLAAIQGRMPGVQVTQATGVPGGGFKVEIRGLNSLRPEGNEPLYIVDGVPFPSTSLGNSQFSAAIFPGDGISFLNGINPADIKNIEILKDADATAIYGSRGANGVVLITTKQGKSGELTPTIEFSKGWSKISNRRELLNTSQYLEMRKEAFENDLVEEYPFYAYDVNGNWDQERYTDWQEELIGGVAETANLRASLTGGTNNTNFLVTGSYLEETTVFPGDYKYWKAASHLSFNHTSKDEKFYFNFSGMLSFDKNNQPETDLTRETTRLPPNAPAIYDAQGNLNWENSTWLNPLRLLEGEYLTESRMILGSTVLGYRLFNDFEFKVSTGFTTRRFDEIRTAPSTRYNPAYGLGSEYSVLNTNVADLTSYIIEPQMKYDLEFGSGEIEFLAGATLQRDKLKSLSMYGTEFSSNALIKNLSAANYVMVMDNSEDEYKYQAIFGRLNFELDNELFINITGRRDGSSRFGPGKRFANFGAVGAAWIFTEQDWFKNSSFLSFGKLRSSYGLTGNDKIGDYQFLDSYSVTQKPYNGVVGLEPSRLYNPNFGWETTRKFEASLDLGFFQEKIQLSSSYYTNRSSNQLVGIPLPSTTGFNSIQANLGATVENRGWEFTVNTQNFLTKAFTWNTSFNLTIPRSELISFPDLENSTYANTYVIGEPLNLEKAYRNEGIDQNTGLYKFTDFNNDGKISAAEDKRAYLNLDPAFYGGLGNRLTYKNINLDFLFQFVKQTGFNYLYYLSPPGIMVNQPIEVMDRWESVQNPGSFQRFTSGVDYEAVDAFYQYVQSDAAVSDASYIRLKNISFTYNLPEIVEDMDMSIFLRGQNILTISKYRGLDPESQSSFNLPPLKVANIGTKISF